MDEQAIRGTKCQSKTSGTPDNQRDNHISKDLKTNRFVSSKTEWVRLNIGGKCFVTTKTTLCKNANSFFFKLLQNDPSVGLTTDRVSTKLT